MDPKWTDFPPIVKLFPRGTFSLLGFVPKLLASAPGGTMRSAILFCSVAMLAGCSKPDNRDTGTSGADTGISAGTKAASAPAVTLDDFAGKWKTRATDETGAFMGEAELLATADTSSWTLTFPKRKPIPLRVVAIAGDSIVTEAGPNGSTGGNSAQMRSRAVYRLQDGKLVATLEARYTMAGRDSVVRLRIAGTREPS
jgi:hypothetical protein